MEEEESNNGDYKIHLRKNLMEIFGTFDEFNNRINKTGIRNGISRTRLRGKTSPYLYNMSSGSPNNLPAKACLESMKNLVDEPLSSLPPRLRSEQRPPTYHHHSTTASSSSSFAIDDRMERVGRKKRDREDEGESQQPQQLEHDSERHRKHSRFDNERTPQQQHRKMGHSLDHPPVIRREEKDGLSAGLSPDSGVHSTENDLGEENENQSVEDILNIMTGMSVPKLSPIPSNLLNKYQQKEKEKEQQEAARKRKREEEREEESKRRKDDDDKEEHRNRKDTKSFYSVFNDASSSESSAEPSVVSSRQSSVSPSPPPPTSRLKEDVAQVVSISITRPKNGELKLSSLKSDKLHKLIKLAKQNGRLVDEKAKDVDREKKRKDEDRKRRKEKEEKHRKEKDRSDKKDRSGREGSTDLKNNPTMPLAANRKVEQVKAMTPEIGCLPSKSSSVGSAPSSLRPPSSNSVNGGQLTPRSSKNTPPAPPSSASHASSNNSRPSSSMSITPEVSANLFSNAISHTSTNRSQNVTPRQERPDSRASTSTKMTSPPSAGSTGSSTTTSTFRCSWVHTRLTSAQRVAIPDMSSSNCKSKIEFFHDLAKEFKSEADTNKDRILKVLGYINSTVYFIMEALSKYDKDRSVKGCNMTASIYKDIHKLLRSTVSYAMRDTSDTHFMHMLPRIKILTQAVLSIILYQTYLLKSEQSLRNIQRFDSKEFLDAVSTAPNTSLSNSVPSATNKLLANAVSSTNKTPTNANSASSTPKSNQSHFSSLISGCNTTTMIPTVLFDMMRQQIRHSNLLVLAQRYWQDSRNLAAQVDPEFLKGIESLCGKTLSMDSSFEIMAPIVLTAVASLKAEYEKEKANNIKPAVNKVKSIFDAALKLGGFYAIPEPQQGQQSTTPLPQNMQKPRQNVMSSSLPPPPPPM